LTPLIQAGDVAEILGVPVGWVREHTRAGHLPHVQLGRYVRYERDRVLEYVAEQRQGGEPLRRPRRVA
jgi:excisionase family DNA binding protein